MMMESMETDKGRIDQEAHENSLDVVVLSEDINVDAIEAEKKDTTSDNVQKLPQAKKVKKKKKKKGDEEGLLDEDEDGLKKVPYYKLYRFASAFDIFLIIVGVMGAIVHGSTQPIFSILFGQVLDDFAEAVDPVTNEINYDIVIDSVRTTCLYFVYAAIVSAIASYLQVACFIMAASNQAHRLRLKYFDSLLRQDMKWYDNIDSGELTARIITDVAKVEQGIADKVGSFLQYTTMGIGGLIVGFVYGWRLTLVIFAASPLLVAGGAVMGMLLGDTSSDGQKAYSKADSVANEVFSMIRTVVAFSGEEEETLRYKQNIGIAYNFGIKKSWVMGAGMGFTMGCIFLVVSLGYWAGYQFLLKGWMTTGDVTTTFFACLIGAMAVGQAAPSIQQMATASGAASFIFEVIDRQSEIDQLSAEGLVPEENEEVKGEVTFQRVDFEYTPGNPVLQGMTFDLKKGETLALIGQSGCGKSTTIQLIERFYNAEAGVCSMDGRNIRDLNIQWFRSQIGIVSQMPSLFATTIGENIALGIGYRLNPGFDPNHPESVYNCRFIQKEVTQEMIVDAAKKANAHSFIMAMPEAYDTMVGSRGAQLSGGQKQRIAIARALIRDPKILLLDEATSALDSQSERVVQDALDKASVGRTTIVIAHRLSTIQKANKIAVVSDGKIIEMGNHASLMALEEGHYRRMKEMQDIHYEESNGDPEALHENSALEPIANDRKVSDDRKISNNSNTYSDEQKEAVVELEGREEKEEAAAAGSGIGPIRRAFSYNRQEFWWIFLGAVGSIINGCTWPAFSLAFAKVLGAFQTRDDDEVTKWVIVFVGVGFVSGVGNFLGPWASGVAGERLTRRIRLESFKKIIHQPIHWFDHPQNSVGILTTRLSQDATLVRGLTADSFNILVTQLSTLFSGLIIAFTACPQLAGVVLACIPVVGFGAALNLKLMSGFMADGAKVYEAAGKIAGETVDNIRTVNALNCGYYFLGKYAHNLEKPKSSNFRKAQVAAIIFGFSEFCVLAIWALAFWYGTQLISQGKCDFEDMMIAISAIVFGAMTMGEVAAMAPNAAAGRVAAVKVFQCLDLNSDADVRNEKGERLEISGNVEFNDIGFIYPTRPEIKVLTSVTCNVKQGQTMALVGESGCGKSTLISLVEQFYKPESGQVKIDGTDINKLNLKHLRSQIGIVSQEPDLFNKTIRENICYGLSKSDITVVTDEQIEWAAKKANAHDFITALPGGYDSCVGERGGLLSGGQKQRIAIARALIRDPKILLLDEATSALDSQSEKVVEVALDQAKEGRTTIVIAHRLSTISGSDKICVIGDGKVLESGDHSELIEMRGAYYNLVAAQNGTL